MPLKYLRLTPTVTGKKNGVFQVSVDRWIFIVKKWSRYQKSSPWSEVFFGHIFGTLRCTPYIQSAKNSFAGHFENPQFSVLSASEHLQRSEMCPHHQDFFYLVKLLNIHKKLLRKYLVPRNTPRTPNSNNKPWFLAYRPNFDPQNPGVGGVGAPKFFCHKSSLYQCRIHRIMMTIAPTFTHRDFFVLFLGQTPQKSGVSPYQFQWENEHSWKVVLWVWYYRTRNIYMKWFPDKNISALRHTLPSIFGGRIVVTTPNFRNFQAQKFFFGRWVETNFFAKRCLPYRVTEPGRKSLGDGVCSISDLGLKKAVTMQFWPILTKPANQFFGGYMLGVSRSAPKFWKSRASNLQKIRAKYHDLTPRGSGDNLSWTIDVFTPHGSI